jgi:hypothetical protein
MVSERRRISDNRPASRRSDEFTCIRLHNGHTTRRLVITRLTTTKMAIRRGQYFDQRCTCGGLLNSLDELERDLERLDGLVETEPVHRCLTDIHKAC